MASFQKFITTDTALASFISVAINKEAELFLEQDPVEFCFEQNGTNLKELEFQWKSGIATCNVVNFFRVYRNYIDTIKTNRRNYAREM